MDRYDEERKRIASIYRRRRRLTFAHAKLLSLVVAERLKTDPDKALIAALLERAAVTLERARER